MFIFALIASGMSFVPVGPAMAKAAAFDTCGISALNSLQQLSANQLVMNGFATYDTNGFWNVRIDDNECGIAPGQTVRAESWIDGAQRAPSCQSPGTLSGYTCVTVIAEGAYANTNSQYMQPNEVAFVPGTIWCSRTNAVFHATTGAETMDSDDGCETIGGGGGGGGGEEDPPTEDNGGGNTPIVMPLTNAQAFKLTSVKDGVQFDLNADGVPEQTAWTTADSKLAFLAIDRDGDGFITSGTELFGDRTLPGVSNGFVALRLLIPQAFDARERGHGVIDAEDPIYSKLLLWEDANHNGISEPSELQPLANLYSGIGLGASDHMRKDGNGNLFRYRGWAYYRTAPGVNKIRSGAEELQRRRDIYDVVFVR